MDDDDLWAVQGNSGPGFPLPGAGKRGDQDDQPDEDPMGALTAFVSAAQKALGSDDTLGGPDS